MWLNRTVLIALLGILLTGPVMALDQEQQDALKDTEDLLNNEARLDNFVKGNKDAKNAIAEVDKLSGGDPTVKAKVNSISGAVFKDMVKQTNGDDAAILEKLQQGLKDPKAFMQGLSPEQQAEIKQLAAEIDAKKEKDRAPASVK